MPERLIVCVPGCRGSRLEENFFGHHADFSQGIPRYQEYNEGVVFVRKNQKKLGWNMRNPKTEFGRNLFLRVRRDLNCYRRSLRLCCALGSALDYYHGIDGFFFFEADLVNIVTFDLSENKIRKLKPKADFVISGEDLCDPEKTAELASQISRRLRTSVWSN